MLQIPDLLMKVPRGLEDVAAGELKSVLSDQNHHCRTIFEPLCGYLLLSQTSKKYQSKESVISFLRILAGAKSIEGCYAVIGQVAVDCTDNSPRNHILEAIRREIITRYPVNSAIVDAFSYPNTLPASIDLPQNSCCVWTGPLQLWSSLSHRAPSSDSLRFRATFEKSDCFPQSLSKVPTSEYAGTIGAAVLDIFPSLSVDLKHFELEVFSTCLPISYNFTSSETLRDFESDNRGLSIEDELTLTLSISLPIFELICDGFDVSYRHRKFFGQTSLRPTVAYSLGKLVDIKVGDVVLDPCCGVATVPIETYMSSPHAFCVGGDFKADCVYEKAKGNIEYSNTPVDLFAWDAKSLPLRNECIDYVITDLPWGHREGSFNINCKLYPSLFRNLTRIIRPSGKIIIVSGERKLVKRVLNYSWCMLELEHFREVVIGFKVGLWILKRRLGVSLAALETVRSRRRGDRGKKPSSRHGLE
ncbi:putative RNA methylase family UPF0020-domain-containing protein [Paraphysoderma sedebokerense]|nr:putative RNA methylase family UPF0020-domain-containing protein [Paraphysoderma sedebokerense]